MQEKLIKIGYVGKPNGLRGAFFVAGRSAPIPLEVKNVFLRAPDEKIQLSPIKSRRMQAGRPVLLLEHFQDRETLRLAMGWEVLIKRDDLAVAEDEYCWADIVGKNLVDTNDELVGRVDEIDNYGATDVLTVSHPRRGRLSLPFVKVYVDMTFKPEDAVIRMLVPVDTFEEAWEI